MAARAVLGEPVVAEIHDAVIAQLAPFHGQRIPGSAGRVDAADRAACRSRVDKSGFTSSSPSGLPRRRLRARRGSVRILQGRTVNDALQREPRGESCAGRWTAERLECILPAPRRQGHLYKMSAALDDGMHLSGTCERS
jgi:hypothetical protein